VFPTIISAGLKSAVIAVTLMSHHPAPVTVVVQPGQNLSIIAQEHGTTWPRLFDANARVTDPALIDTGWTLVIPARDARLASRALPAPPVLLVAASSPDSAPSAPAQAITPAASPSPQIAATGTPVGSFGACVVARESGGNAQVMNSSGHYGLYQFSASTWQEYGGSAASFGNASASQQEQVFSTALAAGGESNWSPYDGC
jgi:LysM repeat protein